MKTKPLRSRFGRSNVPLLERVTGFGRVDVEKGIIFGAKLVGLESLNTARRIGLPESFGAAVLDRPYRYEPAALAAAVRLYEGAAVKLAHPPTAIDGSGRRIIKPRIASGQAVVVGTVRNVQVLEDGLYGDVHLQLGHAATPLLISVARRSPNAIALSHNARGDWTVRNGQAVIHRILSVASVDIVGDRPGTTVGLFESAPFFKRRVRAMAKDLKEADVGSMTTLEELQRAAMAILSDESADDASKVKRMIELMSMVESDSMMESYFALEAEKDVRRLLESASREASEDVVSGLAHIRDERLLKAVIDKLPSRFANRRPLRSAPLMESASEDSWNGSEELFKHARRGTVRSIA